MYAIPLPFDEKWTKNETVCAACFFSRTLLQEVPTLWWPTHDNLQVPNRHFISQCISDRYHEYYEWLPSNGGHFQHPNTSPVGMREDEQLLLEAVQLLSSCGSMDIPTEQAFRSRALRFGEAFTRIKNSVSIGPSRIDHGQYVSITKLIDFIEDIFGHTSSTTASPVNQVQ